MAMSYITPEGAEAFASELKHLWRVERPEWTARVSAAAAEGDRSENAEYIYGKKKLRELDRRIRFLTKVLDECKVVSEPPENQEKVYFGAWVEVMDSDGNSKRLRIVGPHESDLKRARISMLAPMAKALLGKSLGDEVLIVAPEESKYYSIVAITYDD